MRALRPREVAAVPAAATIFVGLVVGLTLLRSGDHARYELSGPVIGAALLTPIAAWVAARGRSPALAGLGFAVLSLLLLGFLTVFSGAGLLLLPLGAIAATMLALSLRRTWPEPVARRARRRADGSRRRDRPR